MRHENGRKAGRRPFAALCAALALVLTAVAALPAFAAQSASVEIAFTAEEGSVVTVSGEEKLPDTAEVSVGAEESGSFTFTYDAPGKYEYAISNGRETYDVYVTAYYEGETLVAVAAVYKEGSSEKSAQIDFERTPKPTPTPTAEMTPTPTVRLTPTPTVRLTPTSAVPPRAPQTGDASNAGIYLGSAAAAFLAACAIAAKRRA